MRFIQCRTPGAGPSPARSGTRVVPGWCGCANTGRRSTDLSWAGLGGKPDIRPPKFHFPPTPSERSWSILQVHIQRSFWERCPLCLRAGQLQAGIPLAARQRQTKFIPTFLIHPNPTPLPGNRREALHRSVISCLSPHPAHSKKEVQVLHRT